MDYQKLFEIKKTEINRLKHLKKNHRKPNSFKVGSCFLFSDAKKIDDLNRVIKKLPKGANIILREYNLEQKNREEIAREFIEKIKKFGHKLIIGKDFEIATKVRALGAHFSDKNLTKISTKNHSEKLNLWQIRSFCRRKKMLFSLALHDLRRINYVAKLAPDIIFLSPIFKSSSHQNQSCIGIFSYVKFCKIIQRKIPSNRLGDIAPLGGINLHNLRRLNRLGLSHFGAIDFFKNL